MRHKTTLLEIRPDKGTHQSANRRVFYDFTFSPPQSVSIAAQAGGPRMSRRASPASLGSRALLGEGSAI
jgi:hypothetical protein